MNTLDQSQNNHCLFGTTVPLLATPRPQTAPHHQEVVSIKHPELNNPIFRMEEDTCISYLKRAVEMSKSKRLSVKLNSTVNSRDATAIDVTYHMVG